MRALRLGLLFALSLTPSAGAQDAPPARVAVVAPAVQDDAAALDAAALARIGALSQEAWTRAQVSLAVTLVRDTGPRSVDAFARENWRARGLGGRAVLLVVAVDAHTNHLEVGDAVATRYPASVRRRVLDQVFAPAARAQGVRQATVRAVEALHAQALRLDAREGLGDLWGWLWRYGGVILVGAVGADRARRELLRRRDAVRSRAAIFRERLTTYRTLRARLSPSPTGRGAYRRSSGAAAVVSDEVELSALDARATAARDAWGDWEARVRALDAVTAALQARLAPLEARVSADDRAKALRAALPEQLEALRAELAEAPTPRAPGDETGAPLAEAREAVTRARAELEALSREVPAALERSVGLVDLALVEACDALDGLQQRIQRATRDAAAPRLRRRELESAAADIATLAGELEHRDSEAIAASRPGTPTSYVTAHQERLAEAQALRGGDPVRFAEALRALHRARLAMLGASAPERTRRAPRSHASVFLDRLLLPSKTRDGSSGGGGSSGGSQGSSGGW